jgi:hypothetical protein
MKGKIRLLIGPALVPVLVTLFMFGGQTPSATPTTLIKNKVIQRELAYEMGKMQRPKWAQKVSSGSMYNYLLASGLMDNRLANAPAPDKVTVGSTDTQGCSNTFHGGAKGVNVRVNQDCSLRRQAEEAIAVNPLNRNHLIASQNDSRIGFNHCGYDFSFDGGSHWGDGVDPFFQILLGNGHTGDFCSDPTVTWDSKGNAFLGGLSLAIDGLDSAVLVARADAGIDGAFYHDPDQSDPFHQYRDSPVGTVAEEFDSTGCTTNDKELMTADAHVGSPKADNLYMVWTRFDFCTGEGVGAHSPIVFSQSTDGGFTWSDYIEISGSNTTYCTAFSGESDPNACDQDQGGHPVVAPDGTVYVAFGNGNTPTAGINQHMVVSCAPGNDCSQQSSWQGPYFITDDIGTQPTASVFDPVSGCPAGRQCLPPNGYRLDDFVHGSLSIDNAGRLYFAWDDFRNGTAPCDTLDYATSQPPCNNDVFYSFSTNGGTSWVGPYLVTANGGDTAQWMPWSGIGPKGDVLWIGYYSREYKDCEFTGCNDIVLAKVANPRGSKTLSYERITSASMPNLVVANNPVQAGFLGDYMWVTVSNSGKPYIVWADTRGTGRPGVVEEDIYFAS